MSVKKIWPLVVVVLGCTAIIPSPRAQESDSLPLGTRRVVGPGLPAIDRGLRADRLALPTPLPAPLQSAGGDLPYLPGRVIVKYRPGLSPAALAAVTSSVGATTAPPRSYANFSVLAIDQSADPEAVAALLNARPEVEYAQAAYRMELYWTPNDPMYASQWNFPAIGMEGAWDINQGASSKVVVAVLDSGIAFEDVTLRFNTRPIVIRLPDGTTETIEHGTIDVPFAAAPDLAGPGRFVAPFDFAWNDVHPVDTLGHGTHVAGTIGQLTNNGVGVAGMAFNVRLMPVKVFGSSWDFVFGAEPAPADDQIARAIRYAADNGAHVLNMSFGRSTDSPAPVIEDAIRYAVSRGAFCVIAAGNRATSGNPVEVLGEIASRVDGAVSVGAVGRTLERAEYSARGSWVELTAPGGDTMHGGITGGILQQTLDRTLISNPFQKPRFDALTYGYLQGTSMAAPHVSGFAALLIQQGITRPAAIEAAMKRFATDRGPAGRDDEYGDGIINPRATLRGLGLAR